MTTKDFISALLKYKWHIITFVLLIGIGSFYNSLQIPNIYRSEATITLKKPMDTVTPGFSLQGGLNARLQRRAARLDQRRSLMELQLVLRSRKFTQHIVQKHGEKLFPYVFLKRWDPVNKEWRDKKRTPSPQQITRKFNGIVKVKADRKLGLLTVWVNHRNPAIAKRLVDLYLTELSEFMRKETIEEAQANQRFLRHQLERIADVLLKKKIYALIAQEEEEEVFAWADSHYGFQILDPPIVPDQDKYVRPNRIRICIVSTASALFLAVCSVFCAVYLGHLAQTEKERIQKLKAELCRW